jgi:hypothetical protein
MWVDDEIYEVMDFKKRSGETCDKKMCAFFNVNLGQMNI